MTRQKFHPSIWCVHMCTHVSGHSYMIHSDTDEVRCHMPESPKALISDTNTSGSQTADPERLINYCVRWFSCENCWGICAYLHTGLHFESCNTNTNCPCDVSDKQTYLYVLCMSNMYFLNADLNVKLPLIFESLHTNYGVSGKWQYFSYSLYPVELLIWRWGTF